MDKEEIENRIHICEERENGYREIGNTRIADKYSNEKYKWEQLLSRLDSKRDEELRDYKIGYSSLKQAINEIREYIIVHKLNDNRNFMDSGVGSEFQNILQIIDKVVGS